MQIPASTASREEDAGSQSEPKGKFVPEDDQGIGTSFHSSPRSCGITQEGPQQVFGSTQSTLGLETTSPIPM